MQKIATFLLCSTIFLTISCSKAISSQETSRSANFSFTYRHTPCGSIPVDVFDSSKNTLTHTPLDETESMTISLQLTDDELGAIYEKAIEIDFFNLPAKLTPPDDMIQMTSAPAGTYELSMTNGEIVNSVFWKSDITTDPLFNEAAQFLELMFFIQEIISSHHEYQQLPEPIAGCA